LIAFPCTGSAQRRRAVAGAVDARRKGGRSGWCPGRERKIGQW